MAKVRRGRSDGPTSMGSAQINPALVRSGKRMNDEARNQKALRTLEAWIAEDPRRRLLAVKLAADYESAYDFAIALHLMEPMPVKGRRQPI